MEYTTIPLWQPTNNDDPDDEDYDLMKISTKTDRAKLFLFENDVKKAIRKYVKENYNLIISDIDFHNTPNNIYVDCTVEENE